LRQLVFALVLLGLSLPLWAAAHTTVLVPVLLPGGGRAVRIIHFHPYANSDLMGIRLKVGDSPKLKGLERIFWIHQGKEYDLEAVARPGFLTLEGKKREIYTIPLNRKTGFTRAGDYVLVVEHRPHWKAAENLYRQKIAKLYCNLGGKVTDWPRRLLAGAPEIIPLVPPTGVVAGDIFRAEVVNDAGLSLPYARIEVEYLSRIPGPGRLAAGVEIVVPHLFADLGAGEHPARRAHQALQQGELAGGQFDFLAIPLHLVGHQVEGQILDLQQALRRAGRASRHRLNAGN